LVFAAWALGSGYRGWTTGQISQAKFVGLTVKVTLIYILLTFLLLH
jgi:integrating conjugative element protein (TIGR03758 family)